jgi:cytochrome c oxidase cbb3-type subunit 3
MSKDPKDPLLLDHEYDGIQELDNNLPRWWVWLFYITIIFSAVYLVYYHVSRTGDLQAAEYEKEMKAAKESLASGGGSEIGSFEASIPTLQPLTDKAALDNGQLIYVKYCAACHRVDGGGLVGPNLTDDYWIHGSNYSDTVTIIWNGVPDKGMLAWKKQGLKPTDIVNVASYIYTLRGAKLVTPGKPPESQQPAKPAGPSQFE